MSILFYLVFVVTCGVFARARVGLAWVALLSGLFYFMPGLFGFDLFAESLDDGVYAVFALVLGAVALYAWLPLEVHRPVRIEGAPVSSFRLKFVSLALIGFYAVFLKIHGISWVFLPGERYHPPPAQTIPLRLLPSFGLIYGVQGRSKVLAIVAGSLLAFNLMFDRTGPVLAVIGMAIVLWSGETPMTLVRRHSRAMLGLSITALLAVFGKQARVNIKQYLGTGAVVGVSESSKHVERLLEPFGTQAILNRILKVHYALDPRYLLDLPAIFLPSSQWVGVSSSYFNERFQAELFGGSEDWGLAYNYWGEAIATGGGAMLVLFLAIYLIGVYGLSSLMRTNNREIRSIACLAGVYWTFYIHRNSLFSICSYLKQIFYYIGGLVVFMLLLEHLLGKRPRQAKKPALRRLLTQRTRG